MLREDGVIGLAHTLVETDEEFKSLMKNLLGRTVVVENIDVGIRLARKYRQTVPDGDTGGRASQSGWIHDRRGF